MPAPAALRTLPPTDLPAAVPALIARLTRKREATPVRVATFNSRI